jgi:hypothetical protein
LKHIVDAAGKAKKDPTQLKAGESKNIPTTKPTHGDNAGRQSNANKSGINAELVESNVKPISQGEWVASKNAQQRSQAKSAIGELAFHADNHDNNNNNNTQNINIVPPINIVPTPRKPAIAESHVV